MNYPYPKQPGYPTGAVSPPLFLPATTMYNSTTYVSPQPQYQPPPVVVNETVVLKERYPYPPTVRVEEKVVFKDGVRRGPGIGEGFIAGAALGMATDAILHPGHHHHGHSHHRGHHHHHHGHHW